VQAVARLTGDNVVLLLRVRGAEEAAAAATAERDMLRLAVEERRGPWFEQARPALGGGAASGWLDAPGTPQFADPSGRRGRASSGGCGTSGAWHVIG
jgi:hypothetical protein